ncbi:endosome/lysosome-associated apoptosis and autophagy regulator 1-like, partial [Hyalella azteca]|uniref:Endosome/lysosome-associated apoptosis and autophagy regulator 1-like n=1 Tax=Hyalella azteca TaxID=294128 RepID=A0A979FGG1_HYAAZ
MEVGRISFTFQLDCSSECEFVFMEGSAKKGVTILQSWTGQQPRQFYSYLVRRNDSFTFSWAFQKVSWEKSYLRPSSSRRYEGDVAKIFNINVTNTVDGGASTCLPCPQVGLSSPVRPQVHPVTQMSTRACEDGRRSTVTVRCALEESGQGAVTLPKRCPDGTCDGCNFHFLWATPYGCPICSPTDL